MMITERIVCIECGGKYCFATLNHARLDIICHDCDWKFQADYVPHPQLGKLVWSLEE